MNLKLKTIFIILAVCLSAGEIDLAVFEKGLYSRGGEDGVIAALFQIFPPEGKISVELNISEGGAPSSTLLLRSQGWKTYVFDPGGDASSDTLLREYINAGNVNKFFRKYEIPERFELLCIHLRYNDFYVWNALDQRYKPSIVLISYNGLIAPENDKVVEYNPFSYGGGTDSFGAGIVSMTRLGKEKGYSLIYADRSGNSLFFLRKDLFEEGQFKNLSD